MKTNYKCVIIGHFGFGKEALDGQTIKTHSVCNELEKKLEPNNILKIDTSYNAFSFLFLLIKIVISLNKTKNVIFLLANRGIQIVVPLLLFFNKRKKCRLHYIVIGGWLPSLCSEKTKFASKLKKIDRIYVETNTMYKTMIQMGFNNILVMPNFKELTPLEDDSLVYQQKEPFYICTFSRVMKEKGIGDIVEIVKRINKENNKILYKLDIFGKVDDKQIEWFDDLKNKFPSFIEYKGAIMPNETTSVVKKYFALVFPTKFFTEGIPGTILDAYFAGVPVIASKWQNCNDLIDQGKTGLCYEFGDNSSLFSILDTCAKNPKILNDMKKNCLLKASIFSSENAINIIDFADF